MTLDQIAGGANASERIVVRAFTRVLDLMPQAYIRQLGLNRIRAKLVSETERTCTSLSLQSNGDRRALQVRWMVSGTVRRTVSAFCTPPSGYIADYLIEVL